jgi:hypothetical protein
MANVQILDVIQGAVELYRARWRDIIIPFLAIFAIGIILGGTAFLLSFFHGILAILGGLIGVAGGWISVFIIVATLVPISEFLEGKSPSNFVDYIPRQALNSVLIIILRAAATLASFIPLALAIALNVAATVALLGAIMSPGASRWAGIAAVGGFAIVFFLGALMSVILALLVNFFLTFLEVEVVLGNKGFVESIQSSFSLVRNNLLDVFLFDLVWWLIGIAVHTISVLLCCTIILIPVYFILTPLIVTPIEWISKVALWKELSGLPAPDAMPHEEKPPKIKTKPDKKSK